MSEHATTPETPEPEAPSTDAAEAPQSAPETPAETPAPETTPETAEAPTEPEGEELDADTLRVELKAARAEAAKYRVKAREVREALEKAKSPEEFESVQSRMLELENSLHRERLARKYSLPDALAARITGDDDESREADAKALAEVLHARSGGVGRGGLDPSVKPTPSDPKELAKLVKRDRRF